MERTHRRRTAAVFETFAFREGEAPAEPDGLDRMRLK